MQQECEIAGEKTPWQQLLFVGIMILFIASNVILLKRYQQEKALRLTLSARLNKEKSSFAQAGFAEISRWQAELKAWPMWEEAWQLWQQKEFSQALVQLNNTIETSSDIAVAYYLRAQVNYILQNDEQGIVDIDQYIKMVPSTNYGLLLRANFYSRRQQWQAAKGDLKQLLEQQPDLLEANELLEKIEKLEQAAENF